MTGTDHINECKDPMQSVTIELPCALVERVNKLARENDTTLSAVLIEALDAFLRKRVQQID
jgi:predicted transcriptional regulator